MSDTLEKIKEAIVEGDDDIAVADTEQALQEGINPAEVVRQATVPGIERAGELWKDNVYFMPDVVLSAEAFKAAMEVLSSSLSQVETETCRYRRQTTDRQRVERSGRATGEREYPLGLWQDRR